MKLGAQEVRTALRRTCTSLAGVVARVRAFVGSTYVSSLRALNSFLFPFLSVEADKVFSKSTMDAWSVRMSRFATITTIVLDLLIWYAIFTQDPMVATLHGSKY